MGDSNGGARLSLHLISLTCQNLSLTTLHSFGVEGPSHLADSKAQPRTLPVTVRGDSTSLHFLLIEALP